MTTRGTWFVVIVSCASCASAPVAPDDEGWVDSTLRPSERVLWPGLDRADGRRIPFIRGFGEGEVSGYWFLGSSTEETIDSFWFCREDEPDCPLDAHHRLDWRTLVGHPLFTYLPGDPSYSHWWQMWTVVVPDDFEPDSIRTVGTLFRMAAEGRVRVESTVTEFDDGPGDTILHCALVLRGTELEDNGGPMPDGVGRRLALERHFGWRQGYRVEFIDFSPQDGVFPAAPDSGRRPRMPVANLYVPYRSCEADPRPWICELPGDAAPLRRPISEQGLGQDITGDGDADDTNNIAGALPCRRGRREEPRYSPLWAIQAVDVPAGSTLRLIDDSGEPDRTDLASAAQIFEAVDAGLLPEPRPVTGGFLIGDPDDDEPLLFDCPIPVPEDHVPFPCPSGSP